MTARIRKRRSAAIALVLLALGGSAFARRQRAQDTAREWADGPVRWLLSSSEIKELKQLRDERAIDAWIVAFWRHRDADPRAPGTALKTFNERVRAADQVYGEGDRRGSLTPRGRATILLGPPPNLRFTQREVPTLRPERRNGVPVLVDRLATIEIWIYGPDDLAPPLVERLEAAGQGAAISLSFAIGDDRSRLIEGEELLALAARAWVRDDSAPAAGR